LPRGRSGTSVYIKKYQIDGEYKCLDFDALGAPFDWVISIEVGEHIPAEYMMVYIGIIFNNKIKTNFQAPVFKQNSRTM